MGFKKKFPIALYLVLFFSATIFLVCSGKEKGREQPVSFSVKELSLDKVEVKVLKEIDPDKLLAEDLEQGENAKEPRPLRFAVQEAVKCDLENSGTWETVDEGRVWRLIFQAPNAKSMSLGIARFNLAEGQKFWIYDPEGKLVQGPYTSQNRSQKGTLWTPVVPGEKLVAEIFVPEKSDQADVVIGAVNKGYRLFGGQSADKSGACNNDVVCPEGAPWSNQIRSVALYTIEGMYSCSGQLVNNTSIDFTPYFLSANHCGVDAANDHTLVFYWNFQSVNCGDHGGGSLADNQTGAIYRASYAPSDFLLVELSAAPSPASNVFYTGWDATGGGLIGYTSAVGIHHPSGDEKSISFENDPITSTNYLSNTINAAANHWRVADWDDGTTEPGSSGSCLWDPASKRCIGQLHGGYAACGNNDSDWYGKFSVSWTGGGTNSTRLSNWLDPTNTGTLSMHGDPHLTTADGIHYDFQGAGEYVALRKASGSEIQVRQTPIATTFHPGANPYHGLATCVSVNTAVALRVGGHRVTYQPDLSGEPDPNGLQLRIDGELTELDDKGIDLNGGGRISKTVNNGGIQVDFPDNMTVVVTPGWWSSQGLWYLNVNVMHNSVSILDGMPGSTGPSTGPVGGLLDKIAPESWLPALPDGTTVGPMPGTLHERYVVLYEKFGNAWRVTDNNSLFDYASGTSTATFTMEEWPGEEGPCEVPDTKPVEPATEEIAQLACRAVTDDIQNRNCVFDVLVTGETGFAETYIATQRVISGYASVSVVADKNPSLVEDTVTFTAIVKPLSGQTVPSGGIQFLLNGISVSKLVRLDKNGLARWSTSSLVPGEHKVQVTYYSDNDIFYGGSSKAIIQTVEKR